MFKKDEAALNRMELGLDRCFKAVSELNDGVFNEFIWFANDRYPGIPQWGELELMRLAIQDFIKFKEVNK